MGIDRLKPPLFSRDRLIAAAKRSRPAMIAMTVLAWFAVSGTLGTLMWHLQGRKQPWALYFYNAFTIFSNLNDDLGLTIVRPEGAGLFTVNIPMMVVSIALIIAGMIGIALLTAQITQGSMNMDEERFDRLVDEFRSLAIRATTPPVPGEPSLDPHRALNIVIGRIHGDIVPARTNTSVHSINIYEFEYILVNIINRLIDHGGLLDAPAPSFAAYNLEKVQEIIRWAGSLDILCEHLCDPHPSPINRDFKRAWRNFSVALPDRIREAKKMAA